MKGGATKVESKLGKIDDTPTTKDKAATYAYAHKRCSTWNSSQSPKKNPRKCTLVSLCLADPPREGRNRHHWGNIKNKCQATT